MATKTTFENIRLGIFVLLGTVLLLVAAYLIGNRQNMFVRNFTLTAVFKNVNGLQNGNNVRFSGINIGTVDRIEMLNDTTIVVYMVIEDKMRAHIRKNAIATIGSDGLVGSMLVNIVPNKVTDTMVVDGDELQTYSRISSQDMLSTLNVTNENAALLTSNLLMVTQNLMDGKGVLGSLLTDTIMGTDFKKTLHHLERSSSSLHSTMDALQQTVLDVRSGESMAGVLLADSTYASKLKTVMDNLDDASLDIKNLSERLHGLVQEVERSKGVYHTVVADTVTAQMLKRTLQHIEEGTRKFDENMEALKHNFLTRGYFRRLERDSSKVNP